MPTKIILTKPWKMSSTGLVKEPGTELVFSNNSEELAEIIESDHGYPEISLPVDMPGREAFIKSGFDSIQKLKHVSSWTDIKGIGEKTANEIDNYFLNKNKQSEE